MFVRHGCVFVKVYPNRLCKIKHEPSEIKPNDNSFEEEGVKRENEENDVKNGAVAPNTVSETLIEVPEQHNQYVPLVPHTEQRQRPNKEE